MAAFNIQEKVPNLYDSNAMRDNLLVWNVVDQITGVFSLGFLGVEGEPVRAQGPGSPTPHAHPVLVALLGIGEQPCLLWAFKASH